MCARHYVYEHIISPKLDNFFANWKHPCSQSSDGQDIAKPFTPFCPPFLLFPNPTSILTKINYYYLTVWTNFTCFYLVVVFIKSMSKFFATFSPIGLWICMNHWYIFDISFSIWCVHFPTLLVAFNSLTSCSWWAWVLILSIPDSTFHFSRVAAVCVCV